MHSQQSRENAPTRVSMRSPNKPFIVEVRRAGRASSRPTKDMWATVDAASPEPRHARREADRAFAAAASVASAGTDLAETTGRVLVAQGYRSPLDLRLEADEQERARRRRAKPSKAREDLPVSPDTEGQAPELPETGVSMTGTDEAADRAAPAIPVPPSRATSRTGKELPRHMRWMRRLRHQA